MFSVEGMFGVLGLGGEGRERAYCKRCCASFSWWFWYVSPGCKASRSIGLGLIQSLPWMTFWQKRDPYYRCDIVGSLSKGHLEDHYPSGLKALEPLDPDCKLGFRGLGFRGLGV